MGILDLLIHLEAMGCFDVCRDGQSIAYCLDERGKTQKQISRLERKGAEGYGDAQARADAVSAAHAAGAVVRHRYLGGRT